MRILSIIISSSKLIKNSSNCQKIIECEYLWKSIEKNRLKKKVEVYSLKLKNKVVLDKSFDDFQKQDKLFWTKNSTFFSFSCFVVWKNSSKNRKNRMIVNVRELNVVIQSNAYFVSLQSNIIQMINDCFFISVIDCFEFFYQ